MSLGKLATAAVAATALVAANLGPFAASAYAGSGYGGPRYSHQHFKHGKYKGGPKYSYYRHKRNRSDNFGKGLAIGLGVLLLGSILANADRHNDPYYDRY